MNTHSRALTPREQAPRLHESDRRLPSHGRGTSDGTSCREAGCPEDGERDGRRCYADAADNLRG